MNDGSAQRNGESVQSPELALLLALLRWPAAPAAVAPRLTAPAAIDWPMFLALARRHRVVSLAAATLAKAGMAGVELGADGAAAAATLRQQARALARENLSQIAEAAGLMKLLAEAGIDCVQLKGAPLSVRAFGQPLLRDGRDIDLLIESRNLRRAVAALGSAGYRRLKPAPSFGRWRQALYRRYSHEYVFAAPSGLTVELKTRLQPAAGLLPLSAPDVLRRAMLVDVAGARLATLCDADMMVYLCSHASRHCWFRLKWLADIGALLGSPEIAYGLMADADRLGLAVPALEALKLAHDWLRVEAPEDILARASGDRRVTRRQPVILRAVTQLGPNGDPFAIPGFARRLERSEYGLRSNLAYRCALLEWHMMVAAYAALRALRPSGFGAKDSHWRFERKRVPIAMVMLEHASADLVRERAGGAQGRRLDVFRHFRKWMALSQYGFPFSAGPCPTPVTRFRALARRTRFAQNGRLFRALAHIAMTLGWPVGACFTARATFTRMKLEKGPRATRVFFDMIWLALRHSIPPLEYALYRFNEPARRKDLLEYVYWNDLPGLSALNAGLGADNRDVQDKDRFARICAANGFPHVQTLAVFENRTQVYPVAPFTPDVAQIFVKSLRLKGGAGGASWIRDGAAYRDSGGRRVLAAKLGDEFRKEDCLVQPCIENHPAIARVTNGALAPLRVVTGLAGSGGAEFVTSLITLPHGTRDTSAGIICSIERETGRVRHAALPDGQGVERHPDTGLPIVGIMLPFWRASIELALRAHKIAFARFAFLGWDIALTHDGPLLLETNSGWGALFHQMLDGPLGHTAFSRLVGRYA